MGKDKKPRGKKLPVPSIVGLQQNPVSPPEPHPGTEIRNVPAEELKEREARLKAGRARKSA